jgi:hypothetical protein
MLTISSSEILLSIEVKAEERVVEVVKCSLFHVAG